MHCMQLFPSSISNYTGQIKSYCIPRKYSFSLEYYMFMHVVNYLSKESIHYYSFALQKSLQKKSVTTYHVSFFCTEKSDRCTAYTSIMTTTSNKLHFSWSKLTVTFNMGNRGQIFKSMEIFDSLDTKAG